MPPSNSEVVRAVVEGFNSGDYATALSLCAEDIEFDWSRRLLDGTVVHGHEGVRQFMQAAREIFDEINIPSEDLTELSDDTVLLAGTARFKGRLSGLDVEAYAANLWTVRDGKVTRFRFYQSKEDALADF